ncbi:Armadillo-type fold,Initiation factor eIF-4 gamma, MA3 [Cinara cedri]|uniref:Armadillo-type fold,Initiation factor eIF-4 gamma, MA3 n=1 Tax=Cinara cedri TaxID=506608 RepID=A0A5E4NSW1_9HEMI|nr:Armadillo-type fold,Initiation factor eIF-4 gamma, MA3 [Cinara cedri]
MLSSCAQTSSSVENSMDDLNPEISIKINMLCKNILYEYSEMQNLEDIVYSLIEDIGSVIRNRQKEFVKAMIHVSLDSTSTSRTEAGKIFAELLVYIHKNAGEVLSLFDVIGGFDEILKNWSDYLIDYPQFLDYISTIFVPLFTETFEIDDLRNSCISVCPDNSSILFIKILQTINSSLKEPHYMTEEIGGIIWMCNKWKMSDYFPFEKFLSVKHVNTYFKNDEVGSFILSLTFYNKMIMFDNRYVSYILRNWIHENISEEIIEYPQFMCALTISILMILRQNFSDNIEVYLSTWYFIKYYRKKTVSKYKMSDRELQCLYGIEIMYAVMEYPKGVILTLFNYLHKNNLVSLETFNLLKKEHKTKVCYGKELETNIMFIAELDSFLSTFSLDSSNSKT